MKLRGFPVIVTTVLAVLLWLAGSATSRAASPTIDTQPQSASKAVGETVTLSVQATGTGTLSYTWRKNGSTLSDGGTISGATTAFLTISSLTETDAGSYDVVVANTEGSVTSSTATLSVGYPPSILLHPSDVTRSNGDSASFIVSVTGTPPFTYQWYKDGVALSDGGNISGANSSSLTVSSITAADAGSYNVEVSNDFGNEFSVPGALTVGDPCTPPPSGLVSWWRAEGLADDAIGLNDGTLQGSAGFSAGKVGMAFDLDGVDDYVETPVSGMSIGNGDFTVEGWVLTTATKAYSAIASFDEYSPGIYIGATGSLQLYPGDAAGSGFNDGGWHHFAVVRSAGAITYYKDGASIGTSTYNNAINPAKFYIGSSQFTGEEFDGLIDELSFYNRALGSAEVQAIYDAQTSGKCLPASAPTIITQPLGTTNAVGGVANFFVGASGSTPLSFQWHKDGTAINEGGRFSGVTSSFLSISNLELTDAGDYTVTVTNAAGSVTSTVARLAVVEPVVITKFPDDVSTLVGSSVTFEVDAIGTGPLFVQWFKGDDLLADNARISGATTTNLTISNLQLSDAGFYDVVIFNAGSSSSATVYLEVLGQPQIILQPVARTNNAGTVATFSVEAIGGGLGYRWRKGTTFLTDNTKITGANTDTLSIRQVVAADAVFYSVVVTNAIGSVTSAGAKLTVKDPAINSHPFSQDKLEGGTVTFNVTAAGTAPLSYQWKKGTENVVNSARITGANSSSLTISNIIAADFANYRVVVSNSKGSVTSVDAELGLATVPTVAVQPVSQVKPPGGTVTFQVVASGGRPLNYQWRRDGYDLYDGYNVIGANTPTLTITNIGYADAGDYNVFISNELGDVTSLNAVLTVSNALPTITLISPVDQSTYPAPATITLAASATDSDGSIDYVDFYVDGFHVASVTNATGAGGNVYAVTETNIPAAAYSVFAIAYDNNGDVAVSDTATATVTSDCVLSPAGIISWWRGEDDANDSMGANHGVLTGNAMAGAAGRSGDGFFFDGVSGSVEISDAPVLNFGATSPLTIELWAYRIGQSGAVTLVGKRASCIDEVPPNYELSVHPTLGVVFGGGVGNRVESNQDLPANEWVHLAGTFDGATFRLYMDGDLIGTAPGVLGPPTPAMLKIGSSGSCTPFSGMIDEVAIYNRALSEGEIRSLHAAGAVGKCQSPMKVAGVTLFGGSGDQRATGISVAEGAAYVSGVTGANGEDGMLAAFALPNISLTNAPLWSTNWPGQAGGDHFHGLAVTEDGIYVAGDSYARTTDTVGTKQGKGMLVRFNRETPGDGAAGSEWEKQTPASPGAFSISGNETLRAVTTTVEDDDVHAYVTGSSQSSLNNTGRLFLSKVKDDSTILWTVTDASATSVALSEGRAIASLNGNIYVAGRSDDSGSPLAIVRKYDSQGNLLWSHGREEGQFNGITAFGNAIYTVGASTSGSFLLEKRDEFGGVKWTRYFSRGAPGDALHAVVGLGSRIYAVGSTPNDTAGGTDAIILEIDPETGDKLSETVHGGVYNDEATGIATDGVELYVVGKTQTALNSGTDALLLRLKVAQPIVPLNILTTTLPYAESNQVYTAVLSAVGGLPPYTWSVVSNSLPAGLTLSPNGSITGTPTTNGFFTFVVEAVDSATSQQQVTQQLSINVLEENDLPVVALTSPVNGANYTAPATINLSATASDSDGIQRVYIFMNEQSIASLNVAPYAATVSDLGAGTYTFKAVAYDMYGAVAFSAPVSIRVNEPGSSVIDFEAVDASLGEVSGSPVTGYLGNFGVNLTNETPGTRLVVKSEASVGSGSDTEAASGQNLFTQVDANGKVSYTIGFSSTVAGFAFTRTMLLANLRGVSHPYWRAVAYDSTGAELGAVGEDLINSYTNVPAQVFRLYGPDIAWVRVEADNRNFAAFSSPLLDDFVLSSTVTNIPPSVAITDPPNGMTYTAPADIPVTAAANDGDGTIQKISFYLGPTLIGTATTNPATVTLKNLAPGTYTVRAVATDNAGAIRSSTPIAINIISAPGIKVINFDGMDASLSVGGTTLSNYLYSYGVWISGATPGARVEVGDTKNLAGGSAVVAPSPNNVLTEVGVSGAVFYTLRFTSPYQKVQFTRPALVAGRTGISHPAWRARAFNSSGVELGSVSEAMINSFTNVPARTFSLVLSDIAWVRFESDGAGRTVFPALLIDDLILDANPAAPVLSVAISTPGDGAGFTAPTDITLTASASSSASSIRRVEFYAGPALIGSATTAPFTVTWTNVLAGSYVLKARVIDNADNTRWSAAVNISVAQGALGNATMINFDDVTGDLATYLGQFGVTVADVSSGQVEVLNQSQFLSGNSVVASSSPNVLTQTGDEDVMSFKLQFAEPLAAVQFTRPKLRVGSAGITHPAWTARAYDAVGVELASTGEDFLFSYVDVDSTTFSLQGQGISEIVFESNNRRYAAFDAVLLDDLILTKSSANLPPVVKIVDPTSQHVLLAPADLTITASATDFDGSVAQVQFFVNGIPVGAAFTEPYSLEWTNVAVGRYTLVAVAVDDDGALRNSLPVTIRVDPHPSDFGILTQPSDVTVASGGTAVFSVTTTDVGLISYQWMFDGANIPGATNSQLVIANVQAADAGSYSVVVRNGIGLLSDTPPIYSDEATLTVLDAPVVTTDPTGQVADMGDDVSFTVIATGTSPLHYQWLLNGHPVSGATESSLTLTGVQPSDAGNYSVIVKNAIGVTRSERANLTVVIGTGAATFADNFADRVSVNPLVGATIGDNTSATLETGEPVHGGKTGGRSIWYTWRASFSGVIALTTKGSSFDTLMAVYTGESLAELSLVASDDDSGGFFSSAVTFNCVEGTDYHIAIDGFYGASGSVVLSLGTAGYRLLDVAGADEQIPFITGHPGSRSVLRGDTVELTVVASSQSPLTYQWSLNGTPLLSGTNSSLSLTNFDNSSVGRYTVRVANEFGSVDSIPATLQIIEADVENHEGIASRDKFAEAREVGIEPSNFRGVKDPVGNAGLTRGYTTAQVFSTVGATKEEGEPNHAGDAGGASEWYTYTAVVNGTLQINTDGSSFNTLLAVYTGPGFDFGSLSLVASDNRSSGNGGDRVMFSATAGTTYYIAVDGVGGASGTVNLKVNLGDAPTIVSAPQSKAAFIGGSSTFNVTVHGSTNFTYQWRFKGTNLSGATASSYTRSNVESNHVGGYSVVISNMVNVITSTPVATLTIATIVDIETQPTSRTVFAGNNTTLSVTPTGSSPYSYSWYFNGSSIAGATNSTLALNTIQTTNAGDYHVVITNIVGAVTSSVATVSVIVPLPSPTSHKENVIVSNEMITFSGTTATNARIAQVQVQVNGGSFETATGSNFWSTLLALAPGTNILGVKAIDASGFESTVTNRTIFYSSYSPFTLLTSGIGEVKPTPNGVYGTPTNGAALVVGKTYKLTAFVGKGTNTIFTNWTDGIGNIVSTNAIYSFLMDENLTLQANFIPNPFRAAAGIYNGLFHETDETRHHSAGFITIKTTEKLAYSAKIQLDGYSIGFGGKFYTPGTAERVVSRSKWGRSDLTVAIALDFADNITGTITCDEWTANITADRWAWTTNNPATVYATNYTMVVPGFDDPVDGPTGHGYATISITPIGKVKVAGLMGDGQKLKQPIMISQEGQWPFYVALYPGYEIIGVKTNRHFKGSIMGWLTFATNTPAGKTTLAPQGTVLWTKKGWTNGFDDAGFTNEVDVLGSRHVAILNTRVMNAPTGSLVFAQGNLTQSFTNLVTLATNNAMVVALPNDNQVKPGVAYKNGAFKGKFVHPDSGAASSFFGVVLQDYNYGRGYFLGTNQSGRVTWEAD